MQRSRVSKFVGFVGRGGVRCARRAPSGLVQQIDIMTIPAQREQFVRVLEGLQGNWNAIRGGFRDDAFWKGTLACVNQAYHSLKRVWYTGTYYFSSPHPERSNTASAGPLNRDARSCLLRRRRRAKLQRQPARCDYWLGALRQSYFRMYFMPLLLRVRSKAGERGMPAMPGITARRRPGLLRSSQRQYKNISTNCTYYIIANKNLQKLIITITASCYSFCQTNQEKQVQMRRRSNPC